MDGPDPEHAALVLEAEAPNRLEGIVVPVPGIDPVAVQLLGDPPRRTSPGGIEKVATRSSKRARSVSPKIFIEGIAWRRFEHGRGQRPLMGPDGRRRPAGFRFDPDGSSAGSASGSLAEACSELLEISTIVPSRPASASKLGVPVSNRKGTLSSHGRPDFIGRKLLQEFPPPIEKAEIGDRRTCTPGQARKSQPRAAARPDRPVGGVMDGVDEDKRPGRPGPSGDIGHGIDRPEGVAGVADGDQELGFLQG